jgi:starch phosphorylase
MTRAGQADEDHARYTGSFRTERAGRYGFTVRIVPRHPDLVSPAEMGLAAWA